VLDDLADGFCRLYDALDEAAFRASVEAWCVDPALRALTRGIEEAALAGALDAGTLEREARTDGRRFAVLDGLDRAFEHVNPLLADVPPAALSEYVLRYAQHGRLDSGASGGALLPRFVRPGRHGQLPAERGDAFAAVVRVGAAEWDACHHVTLPAWARLGRPQRDGGLRIAATPLIEDPDELQFEVSERAGRRFYRIRPADAEATRQRLQRVLRAFDRHGAAIGVAPELCLSRPLLAAWQRALAERPRAARSPLRLVLVGTGDVGPVGDGRPTNTAVLLDAQTGEVLARQPKVFPFNFSPADVELWGLGDRLPAPIDEDLAPGHRITVIEAGGLRLAVLVCEDLARLYAFLAQLRAHGVSLILVPVFARPTKDRRWERARAEAYSDSVGSTIVVANSLVVARILGAPRPAGTAIAVAPGHGVVGQCAEPHDAVLFGLEAGEPFVIHDATSQPEPPARV
jgi:predicted amidohydrolase